MSPVVETALQATANLGWREHGTMPDYGNGRQLMALGLQVDGRFCCSATGTAACHFTV